MKCTLKLLLLLVPLSLLTAFHDGSRAQLYVAAAAKMQGTGHSDKALAFLERALALDPRYRAAYLQRGFLHLQLGHLSPALEDFNHLVELDPQDASQYVTRGMIYRRMGDTAHAAADFRRGCDLGDAAACEMLQDLSATGR